MGGVNGTAIGAAVMVFGIVMMVMMVAAHTPCGPDTPSIVLGGVIKLAGC